MAIKHKSIKVDFAFKPYAKQQEIIDTLNGVLTNSFGQAFRFVVAVLGRQSGKSFLDKLIALDWAINKHRRVMWVSPSIATADPHWIELTNWIENAGIPYKSINHAKKKIHFYGGGMISIRSAHIPDNLRGDTLDLIICDEAAFFPYGTYTWEQVLMPMVTASRGSVLFTSTPNGLDWFYDLYKLGLTDNKYYKSFHASSYDSPYQDADLLDEIRRTKPSLTFRQEYLAEFISSSGGVFNGVERAATYIPSGRPDGHRLIAGLDLGGSSDMSDITIVDIDANPPTQIFGIQFNGSGTMEITLKILQVLDEWKPQKMYMEHNGIGQNQFKLFKEVISGQNPDALNEIISRVDVSHDILATTYEIATNNTKIVAIHMTQPEKVKLVEDIAGRIEYGDLVLLHCEETPYGRVQRSEMSTYIKERTNNGSDYTYNARSGCNDDTISALYLCGKGIPRPIKVLIQKQKVTGNPIKGGGHLVNARSHKIHSTN